MSDNKQRWKASKRPFMDIGYDHIVVPSRISYAQKRRAENTEDKTTFDIDQFGQFLAATHTTPSTA